MSQNICNELRIRMVNAGWQRADISMIGPLFVVSATDQYGRSHGGARTDASSLVEYLMSIGAISPSAAIEVAVSPALAALLTKEETISDGKKRLLMEYDTLTQRLLDPKYVTSIEETNRHEAISMILLELRK